MLLGPAQQSGEDRYGPTRRQKRAGIIALLLLVCFAITDIHLGPVDLFPDAGGYLIAAGALALLGAPVQSRGARLGARAFVVAANVSRRMRSSPWSREPC